MNKKVLIGVGVLAIVLAVLFFVKGDFNGDVVADVEDLPEGFTEKCLSCPKAESCVNYGACKGGAKEGGCLHEEGESCGNH